MEVSPILIAMIESGQRGVSKKFIDKLASNLGVNSSSITPFLYLNGDTQLSDISGLEKQLLSIGSKLQKHLIEKKAKNLRLSNGKR